MLDPLADAAPDRVERWLSGDSAAAGDRLVTIRLRSADPDALTIGEARLLGQADRIFHRPDVPAAILTRARADAAREPCDAPPACAGRGLSIDLGFA